MAMAWSSAMLTVPPPGAAETLEASTPSRVSTARVGGSSFISEGAGGVSGDEAKAGAWSGTWSGASAAGFGGVILAVLRGAFFVAGFGIGKCKFWFGGLGGPIRLTHWM